MLPNQDLLEKTIGLLPKEGATEIAKFLEAQGVKGIKENATQCPVARWLQRELGVDTDARETVIVTGRISAAVNGPKAINIVDSVATPPSVQHFIQKFDLGDFPKLELPRPPSE